MNATLLLLTLLAAPELAQAEPSPGSEAPPVVEPETLPIVASAWCPVRTSRADDEGLSCDAGVGAALYRWRKLSWVAVLGQESLGMGLAVVIARPARGPIPAVALGVVVPWDSGGVYVSEARVAIGATLAFAGRRE